MPKPTKGPRIGGTPTHERIILANLASQLFEHGRVVTTETKAKRVRPLAERLITKAKRGDLHNRRQVLSVVTDKSVVHTLFAEIAPQMEGREGGYTRITKIGPRKGDNAPMAVIELVLEEVNPKPKKTKAADTSAATKAAIDAEVAKDDQKATEETEEAAEDAAAVAEDDAEDTTEASEEKAGEEASEEESDEKAEEA